MGAASGTFIVGAWTRRASRGWLAAGALAALAGCLEFDEQDVRVAYDGKRDQLDAQVLYRGLHSGELRSLSLFQTSSDVVEDDEGTEKNLEQLLAGRPILGLPGSVPIDLADLRESPDARKAALARAITLDQGKFFRDEAGRLCGWQHLQIRDVHAVTDVVDAMLREKLESEKGADDLWRALGCDDEKSSLRLAEAVAKKARFLEVVDGAVLFHVPASDEAARALANRIEAAPPLQSLFDVESGVGLAALLHAIGTTTKATPLGIDLVLWDPARPPQSLALRPPPMKGGRYDLAPHLARRKVEVRTDVTAKTLQADFDERRAR